MNENNELTIHECAQLIFDLMYGKKQKNLLQAYSTVSHKYKIDYSYEEMKDYLFHHELQKTEE
jgi:hypothetical protein